MRRMILTAVLAALGSTAQAQSFYTVAPTPQTCSNGRCGPIQAAAHATVDYVGGVATAVLAPLLPQKSDQAPAQYLESRPATTTTTTCKRRCKVIEKIAEVIRRR